ncbi:hypothetical protein JVU11DRAFT_1198 [Chiua virens]|nr:hypothetical protein JVU11DRAFT_1198 [Chiua virens]
MELVEVYRCPQFVHPVVFAAKFKDVKNAGANPCTHRQGGDDAGPRGKQGTRASQFRVHQRQAGQFVRVAHPPAGIDRYQITSPLHLQTAAMQALFAESGKTMRTKTVHSEIIWHLNPTNNITEAFKLYGVSDTMTDLIVMHIASWEREDVLESMRAVVDGELDLLANISQVTDWQAVMKLYKLDQEPSFKDVTGNSPDERAMINNIVTSSVAMKSIVA